MYACMLCLKNEKQIYKLFSYVFLYDVMREKVISIKLASNVFRLSLL